MKPHTNMKFPMRRSKAPSASTHNSEPAVINTATRKLKSSESMPVSKLDNCGENSGYNSAADRIRKVLCACLDLELFSMCSIFTSERRTNGSSRSSISDATVAGSDTSEVENDDLDDIYTACTQTGSHATSKKVLDDHNHGGDDEMSRTIVLHNSFENDCTAGENNNDESSEVSFTYSSFSEDEHCNESVNQIGVYSENDDSNFPSTHALKNFGDSDWESLPVSHHHPPTEVQVSVSASFNATNSQDNDASDSSPLSLSSFSEDSDDDHNDNLERINSSNLDDTTNGDTDANYLQTHSIHNLHLDANLRVFENTTSMNICRNNEDIHNLDDANENDEKDNHSTSSSSALSFDTNDFLEDDETHCNLTTIADGGYGLQNGTEKEYTDMRAMMIGNLGTIFETSQEFSARTLTDD